MTTLLPIKNSTNILLNASGVHCTTAEQMQEVLVANAAGVVSKSITVEAREGNIQPRYWDNGTISLNSMGLPNKGLEYYLEAITQLKKQPHQHIILSIAGLNLENNYSIFEKINAMPQIDAIELNLSCPNIASHPIIAYNLPVFKEILTKVSTICKKPLGVKLPPYFENHQFDAVAEILNQTTIQFITTINSIPNALVVNPATETTAIASNNGFGGLGGLFIKPTTLANVHQFYKRLKPEISIIGCGGIQNGTDVFEHVLCGASYVQIGSQIAMEGVATFERINHEFQEILIKKGYTTLDQFRGKLKVLESSNIHIII